MSFAWLFRYLGANVNPVTPPVVYDPVYGLPKSTVDVWLAQNPELRRQHDTELRHRGGVK